MVKLRELIKKYLKGNWNKEERNKVHESKLFVASMLMGRYAKYSGDDVGVLIEKPDSSRAVQLREVYKSKAPGIGFGGNRKKLIDHIEELATVHFLHGLLSESEWTGYESQIYYQHDGTEIEIGFDQKKDWEKYVKIKRKSTTVNDFLRLRSILDKDGEITAYIDEKFEYPLKGFSKGLHKKKTIKRIHGITTYSGNFEFDGGEVSYRDSPSRRLVVTCKKYTSELESLLDVLRIFDEE